MPNIAAIIDRRTGISITSAGLIDLGTATDYLNDLRTGNVGASFWFFASGQPTGARYFSAETSATNGFYCHPMVDTNNINFRWTGTDPAIGTIPAAQGVWHNITVVFDVTGDGDAHWVVDGVSVVNDILISGLAAVQSTIIRLGKQADDGANGMAASYGPFAFMDLSNSSVANAATTLSLAKSINAVGPNADQMRRSIRRIDPFIVGKYWKMNELAAGQASIASTVIKRFAIETRANEGTANSVVSGATGIVQRT